MAKTFEEWLDEPSSAEEGPAGLLSGQDIRDMLNGCWHAAQADQRERTVEMVKKLNMRTIGLRSEIPDGWENLAQAILADTGDEP